MSINSIKKIDGNSNNNGNCNEKKKSLESGDSNNTKLLGAYGRVTMTEREVNNLKYWRLFEIKFHQLYNIKLLRVCSLK